MTQPSRASDSREAQATTRKGFATFPNGATSTGWVPMQLHLESYIYLKGKVNGIETDIVLDSGAGSTVIDKAFAESLGLERQGGVTALGVGGTQDASHLAGVRIEIGSVSLQLPGAVGIDMSRVATRLGRNMPVILGREVFEELVVDLDYPRSRLAFHASPTFSYAGPGRTVPIFRTGPGPRLIEVGVEGHPPAKFTIDTGSGNSIDLFKRFWQERRLLDGRLPTSTRQWGGVGGKIVSNVGTLRSVTLAGYELRNVPASFADEAKGGAFDVDWSSGNLGAQIFSRFRFILDYTRERAHLEPGPDFQTLPFRKDRFGFQGVLDDGDIKVTFVSPRSPAEKDGWEVGHRIKAVNGRAASAPNWRADLLQWSTVPVGTEVSLTDGDGRVRKLVAADYY